MAGRGRISLGGVLDGKPRIGAAVAFLLVALALGLLGGYLLTLKYPPPRPASGREDGQQFRPG